MVAELCPDGQDCAAGMVPVGDKPQPPWGARHPSLETWRPSTL